VDFRLTDEQVLLVETAQALFARECPASLVRAVATSPGVATDLFARHLRDWVALAEGPMVDLTLFLTEAGAAVAPGPFLATAGLFAPLLLASGHDLAGAAAAGEAVGTVALAGTDGDWSAPDGMLRTQVIDLDLVDHVAVVVTGDSGPGLAVVDASSLDGRRIETMDLARGTFSLPVPTGLRVAPLDPAVLDAAIERMVLAVAAELVGVARWLVDTAVAYAKERVQFGKPIGSFQAIQHRLVDAASTYQRAAAAVAYAAMVVDADDPDRHRAVHVAKAEAGAAARGAAKHAMQVLGGVGYTWEHDLHLRLRRAYADDALCGTRAWHLDRLAELLFDSEGAMASAGS
jgi:alkylation response protein AidB-like acyl-CoA dehydrogenase